MLQVCVAVSGGGATKPQASSPSPSGKRKQPISDASAQVETPAKISLELMIEALLLSATPPGAPAAGAPYADSDQSTHLLSNSLQTCRVVIGAQSVAALFANDLGHIRGSAVHASCGEQIASSSVHGSHRDSQQLLQSGLFSQHDLFVAPAPVAGLLPAVYCGAMSCVEALSRLRRIASAFRALAGLDTTAVNQEPAVLAAVQDLCASWQLGVLSLAHALFAEIPSTAHSDPSGVHSPPAAVYQYTQFESYSVASGLMSAPLCESAEESQPGAKRRKNEPPSSGFAPPSSDGQSAPVPREQQFVLCSAYPPATEVTIQLLRTAVEVSFQK